MNLTFTPNILDQQYIYPVFIDQCTSSHVNKKLALLISLVLCILFFNFDAIGQSEVDRARIIEKNNQEKLNKIIEAQNKKYQTDLLEARSKGIPEIIIDQNGQIGSFHALLPDGSPTYNFDDAKINPESKSFQLPAKWRKKQVRKSGFPETVTDSRNLKGSLYAVKESGQPIYFFQEMEEEPETQKTK